MADGRTTQRNPWMTVGGIGVLLSVLVLILGTAGRGAWMLWAASAERTSVEKQLEESHQQLEDHEARLRLLEERTAQIGTDVRWIREHLESRP